MQLFYNPDINSNDTTFTFDREESRHIVKVLRKKEGDTIQLTNGKGSVFTAEITFAADKKCLVSITAEAKSEPLPYYLHLAVAPTKMNDRYEWFLEKATEIGISEITPLICEHSERTIFKAERFEKILQSAMKQSLQYHLPKLNAPTSFKDFVNQEHEGALFIAHCEETDKKLLKNELQPLQKTTVLIGPEGDFSNKEIELALQQKYIPVSLGNTRLRTETAAIVAAHSVAFVNEK
ncbi:16S rRNA (uracil(1498)-N(3))-methyltransferase [Flavobacterium salilacus subsp. salilacus]|uniref:16S rRNA (uracil(1498)-N(3))-methyltransferase n=1 Tax=Flavobacterium TaxID=237 RepID=UPI0010750C9D|nr:MULTISPECIES: 16S rRNA (uracil(1498)-N(3))-methyltransferase [Flavobacterium]KAF2519234.1 16S rRNA (uracil(1498)-N(3))-methyltransferase [Flavobacterium salilacus subsp. salilacus]MBE1613416.1 16S rRNA (uracil(1498)-N(3))-methyltransferase [Flavobacterium sp. SaA2.13]